MTIGVRVLAYNIAHGKGRDGRVDLARTAKVIESANPHIVCLQELDRHWGARSSDLDQAQELSRLLSMQVVYGASVTKQRRGSRIGEYGNAVLSRLPILTSDQHRLPSTRGSEPRSALRVLIELDGGTLWVVNTHLSHDNIGDRKAQAGAVRALITDEMGPSVIAGDLNADNDAVELAALADLRDVWTECGVGEGCTHPAHRPNKRLDHILCSGAVRPAASRVLTSNASDHLPLVADLLIEP